MKPIDADAFEKYAWSNPDIEVDGEPYISPSAVQNFAMDHPITVDSPNEPLTCEGCYYIDEQCAPCAHCMRAKGYTDYYLRLPEGEGGDDRCRQLNIR